MSHEFHVLPLCILVTGEPVEPVRSRRGGFADLIRARAGEFEGGYRIVDARQAASSPDALPSLDAVSGIVVTGSAASVTERAPWMLASGEFLARAAREGKPLLGICFGHQLLGQALGGRVEKNPRGREIGTISLEVLDDDPLFSEVRPFLANQTHVDSVQALPPGARVLARTPLDDHSAFRYGERAWGVQFHPEFDADVMRGYVGARSDLLRRERLAPEDLLAGAADAETTGGEVLRRFVRLVADVSTP
jgi:GMP synthase (glutamine-hydrolysing)